MPLRYWGAKPPSTAEKPPGPRVMALTMWMGRLRRSFHRLRSSAIDRSWPLVIGSSTPRSRVSSGSESSLKDITLPSTSCSPGTRTSTVSSTKSTSETWMASKNGSNPRREHVVSELRGRTKDSKTVSYDYLHVPASVLKLATEVVIGDLTGNIFNNTVGTSSGSRAQAHP